MSVLNELISKDKQYKSIGQIVIVALIALFSILTALSALFAYNSNVNEKKAIQVAIKNQNTLGVGALVLSRNLNTLGEGVSSAVQSATDIDKDPSLYIGVQQGLTASVSRSEAQFSLKGAGTAVGFDLYNPGTVICAGNDGLISLWDIKKRQQIAVFGEEQMQGVGSSQRFTDCELSPDKRYFIGSLMAPAFQVWDIAGKRKKLEISMPLFVGKPSAGNGSLFASRMSYALSPDGNFVAACLPGAVKVFKGKGKHLKDQYTGTTTIGVWNLRNDSLKFTLTGNGDMISAIAYSPSGKYIAAGTLDGKVLIWDTRTGKLKKTIQNSASGQDFAVNGVLFENDEQLIITTAWDGIFRIWDVAPDSQGQLIRKETVSAVSVTPAATGDGENNSRDEIGHFTIRLSPDCKRAVTLNDGQAQLWELDKKTQPILLDDQDEPIKTTDFNFSGDGLLIGTAGLHKIRVWSTGKGALLRQLETSTKDVRRIRFTCLGGKYSIITGDISELSVNTLSADGFVKSIWGDPGLIEKADNWPSAVKHGSIAIDVFGGAVSPRGDLVITVTNNGVLSAFDLRGRLKYIVPEFAIEDRFSILTFAKSGNYFLAKNMDGTLLIFDARNGKRVYHYTPENAISAAAISPDGRLLAIAEDGPSSASRVIRNAAFRYPVDGSTFQNTNHSRYPIKIIDLQTNKLVAEFDEHSGRVRDLDFSLDGRFLASSGEDATARVWSLKGDAKNIICRGHHGMVWSVRFSKTGHLISTACSDSTAAVWDAASGQRIQVMLHQSSVTSTELSDDNKSLLTCWQGNVSVWNLKTGNEQNRYIVHDEKFVYNAGFLGTGYLFSVAEDGMAKIYPRSMADWLREAQKLIRGRR